MLTVPYDIPRCPHCIALEELIMIIRDPRLDTGQIQQQHNATYYEQTESIPAIQQQTNGNSIPQQRTNENNILGVYPDNNPCPGWHAPMPKPHIDYERMAGRILFGGMVLFTLLLTVIMLTKIVLMALS